MNLRSLPTAARVLLALAVTGLCGLGILTLVFLAVLAVFSGSPGPAILYVGGALILAFGSSMAWWRLLPRVRWLGVPLALGSLAFGGLSLLMALA